jgi:hypothetical protein
MIQLGMSRDAVLMALSDCCKPTPFGDTELLVPARDIGHGVLFGGRIYFEHGKVVGIAADRDWSTEQASHGPALSFYDWFRKMAQGGPQLKHA